MFSFKAEVPFFCEHDDYLVQERTLQVRKCRKCTCFTLVIKELAPPPPLPPFLVVKELKVK